LIKINNFARAELAKEFWKKMHGHQQIIFILSVFQFAQSAGKDPESNDTQEKDSEKCPSADIALGYDCKRGLEATVLELRGSDLSFEDKLNITCSEVESARLCLDNLIAACSSRPGHVRQFEGAKRNLIVYSRPCGDGEIRRRQELLDCFLPHMTDVHGCMDIFDQEYYENVVNSNSKSACKSVETLLSCYRHKTIHIHTECGSMSAAEFERDYTVPVVNEVSPYVKRNCHKMSDESNHYFLSDAGQITPSLSTIYKYMLIAILSRNLLR